MKLGFALTGIYRAGVVELVELKDGQLHVTHYQPEKGREKDIISATGTKTSGLAGSIVGEWDIAYANGHKSHWTIDEHGNVKGTAQDGPGASKLVYGATGLRKSGSIDVVVLQSSKNMSISSYHADNWAAPMQGNASLVEAAVQLSLQIPAGNWEMVFPDGNK